MNTRASELIDDKLDADLMTGATVTKMLAAMQDGPSEMAEFLEDAVKAVYNDGRLNAGKESDEKFDASDDVDAIMMNTVMFGTDPVMAIYGAFTSVYIKGHDSE